MNAIFSSLIFIFFSTSLCFAGAVNYTEHTLAIFQGYKMPSLEINFMKPGEKVDFGFTRFKLTLSKVILAPTTPFEIVSFSYSGRPVDGQPGLHKLWGRVRPSVMALTMTGKGYYWIPGTRQGGNVNFVADNANFPFNHFYIGYDIIFNPMERQVLQVNITVDTTWFRPKSGFKDCNEYIEGPCDYQVEAVQEVLNEGRKSNEHPILSRAIAQQLEKDRRNY